VTALAPALDERPLVLAILAGDEEAFTGLVRRHSPSLLHVARSYVCSRAEAEDIVQETWLGVLRGLDRFECRSSLKTWIFRIAVNIAKTRGGNERRTLPFSAVVDEPTVDPSRFSGGRWRVAPTIFDRLAEKQALECVKTAIGDLPARQRQVIVLRDVSGLSSHEVCELLDLTPENQRVLLHRARAKVRAALERVDGNVRDL
jgi:RNA polymerase sigma-70 factor (ECF subfamily)